MTQLEQETFIDSRKFPKIPKKVRSPITSDTVRNSTVLSILESLSYTKISISCVKI